MLASGKIVLALSACLYAGAAGAQKISHDFDNTPLPEALVAMAKDDGRYRLQFVFNDLEDFTVTASVRQDDLLSAVRQVVGFHPVRITRDGRNIFLECARKSGAKLTGRLVDRRGEPVMYANVAILSERDSSFITGGVSDEAGRFVIPCGEKSFLVRITCIGYAERVCCAGCGDMGAVTMTEDVETIEDVVVKGTMPKARLERGALVMNVENTVLSRMGSAYDVLTRLPAVMKSGDGIEVVGKGEPVIYINGKKVYDTGELTALQSDRIKSVEVLPNPGARYGADTKSVIIIHTKPARGEGVSVEAVSNSEKTRGFSNNERLNLTYRKNNLEVFANFYGAWGNSRENDLLEERIAADTLWNISETSRLKTRDTSFESKTGFNYQTGEHSFGAFYQFGSRTERVSNAYDYDLVSDNVPYDRIESSGRTSDKTVPDHLLNAYYNGRIGKVSLDFNADYIYRDWRQTALSREESREESSREVNTRSATATRMFAEKLTAGIPLLKGEVTLGEEYTGTRRGNSFSNPEGIIGESDSKVRERTAALFVEVTQQLGVWSLSAGLRYEHMVSGYYVGNVRQTEESCTYDNFFPSFGASATWGDLQFSLDYSSKTQRPNYELLNSSVEYDNRLLYETGNPLLRPTTIHNVSLSLIWQCFYLMAGYNRFKNDIQYYCENYPGDEKIRLLTHENYAKRTLANVTLGVQLPLGLWRPDCNVTMIKQWFSDEYDGQVRHFNRPMFYFSFENVFDFPHKWLLDVDYGMLSKGNYALFSLEKAKQFLSISINKDFFRESLRVGLEASDLLGGADSKYVLESNNFVMAGSEKMYGRGVCLTVRYRFNRTKSGYRGTGAGADAKRRMQGGTSSPVPQM